uniref:Mannose receptor, C type 1b n=1 Tax=Sander lucioperca TaxID=283035 RepID=A0A8D0CM87_SANLU
MVSVNTVWEKNILNKVLVLTVKEPNIYSPFSLTNKATGFCLLKRSTRCLEMRWTTGDRLFTTSTRKCLGAQGKSVGSEVNLYDCDDKSELQKWECKNETLLALKGQQLYIEVKPDETIALSRTVGSNNDFTITGTSSGACSRTYRDYYTIEGNAFGKICSFPFLYKDRWFGDCTTYDSSTKRQWCAVETKYEHEQWGYCPTASSDSWANNIVTGAYYQLNTQSVLTWAQADTSCKQQGASLLSLIDLHEQAFVTGKTLWIGLVLDPEHGWQWSDGKPFRYLRWSTGNPLPNPGHNCAFLDSIGQHTWQSSSCVKKLGYICYKDGAPPTPPQIEQGFCSAPWIPYNGHCFHLHRATQTWSDAQRECRKEDGDLVSIRNVEDQSFVISQLGFGTSDELWIGLNDRKTEGLFDWSDHSTVSFTSWEFGKPSVSTDTEDCILIRGENGNWADRSCDEKHGFICMKQSATESTGDEVDVDIGCKAGWKRHGSYCYFVGTETKTFDEAKEDCKTSDSYLADVSNGVDNAFLVSLVGVRPEKYFWLGLSNQKDIDQFVWTNTDSVRFTHWNAEMPGYKKGCVAMTTGILAGLWDLLPCTNQEKYICKHLAEGAVITVAPQTQTPPQCAEGWIRVGTRNMCSKFFTGPRANEKTWYEARDYCRAIGGDLLSIHSASELLVGRHGKAWIGLHIPDTSTGYTWSDGSPVNFQHWQEGEPNNHNNDESCAEFIIYKSDGAGSWNDVNCDSYNDWLCQIRAGTVEKVTHFLSDIVYYNTTSDGWLVWRGNQYFINTNAMSMEDARHFCQQRHGDLVSVTSKDENLFLWKKISRSYRSYYLGLSVDLDGSFWWMDGSPVALQKWDEDQPNSNAFDENCVFMTYYMGFWRTCNCGQEQQSICKRGNSAPVNTTAAPTVPPKGGCSPKWTKFDSKVRNHLPLENTSLLPLKFSAFLTTKMAESATTDLWIGLNCLKRDGFYWVDGKARQFTNWGHSVSIHNLLAWCLRYCLIEIKNPAVTNIYVNLGNDSIKVETKNLTWDDAKKQCEDDKANLASLRTEWTHAYVELLAMNLKAPLWIGLNKKQTGGFFRYIDGWHLNAASWAEGEPSRDQPCVYMDVDGKWRTAFCNRTMNSVCMLSTDVPPTESTNFPGICPEQTNVEYQQSYTWLPFKGHCYLFMTEEIEWADRKLDNLRSRQQFIKSNLERFQDSHSAFWIGLYKTHKGMITLFEKIFSRKKMYFSCKQTKVYRVHTSLIVVLIIAITSTLIVIAFFLYKKSPRPLPTFDNPLYFDSERSQPDVVDTNKLIENAEVENPEPIITL